jgi:preprotein translocase subunit SecE
LSTDRIEMAKKTSKQGKKAKSESEQKPTEEVQKSSVVEKKPPVKKAAKATKEQSKSSKSAKPAPKKEGIFGKILTYFKNVRLEIKRTTWPSREEVLRMSIIVVGALIFFGVLIFLIDWVMTWFVQFYSGFVIQTPDPSALPDPSTLPDTSTLPDASDTTIPDTTTPDTSTSDTSQTPSDEVPTDQGTTE